MTRLAEEAGRLAANRGRIGLPAHLELVERSRIVLGVDQVEKLKQVAPGAAGSGVAVEQGQAA